MEKGKRPAPGISVKSCLIRNPMWSLAKLCGVHIEGGERKGYQRLGWAGGQTCVQTVAVLPWAT